MFLHSKTQAIGSWRSIFSVLFIIVLQLVIWIIVSRLAVLFGIDQAHRDQQHVLFSLSILLGIPVGLGIIYRVINRRRLSFKEYLGLQTFSFWQALTILLCCMALVMSITEQNGVWIVELIFFPIFVEVLIRGFLYQGLMQAKRGMWFAIVVSTLIWVIAYGSIFVFIAIGPMGMWRMVCLDSCPYISQWLMSFMIFIPIILGMVLAVIRQLTQSLYPTMGIMVALSILSYAFPIPLLSYLVGKDAIYIFYNIPEFLLWFIPLYF